MKYKDSSVWLDKVYTSLSEIWKCISEVQRLSTHILSENTKDKSE